MLADNPKVSIVIPVYNGSNYLREAIDSALAQTYINIEVIVVNDGSNDDGKTESIAKSYGDSIKYIYKNNGGVSTALNLGIKEMTGDYFAWLSHDDLYLKQNIEFQLFELLKYEHALVSYCDATVFYNSNNELLHKTYDKSDLVSEYIHGAICFFERWIYACALLVHRSCFEKIGLVDENLKTSQDIDLTLKLLANFKTVHIKLPMALRRDHPESGFNTIRTVVRNEYDSLLESILAEKGLKYFFPETTDNVSIAKAYNKFGDYLIHDSQNLPKKFYEESVKYWPSLFNSAYFKQFIGTKLTKVVLRIKLSILTRIDKYLGRNL